MLATIDQLQSAIVLEDDLNNRAAAQTNQTSYLLSIVAAVFLPFDFLTGLLGMNVGSLPGINYGHAFWITCGLMAVLAVMQLWVVRKLRWF